MNGIGRRFVLIAGAGLILVFAARLVGRNMYVAAAVELARCVSERDSLLRTRQALYTTISSLESPARLREAASEMGLGPMPIESFTLIEVNR
jgi:hypothetical protein